MAPLEGRGAPHRRAAVRLAVGAGLAMLAVIPTAQAQAQDVAALARILAEDVRCQAPDAMADLVANVAEVQPVVGELVADALTFLGADATACEPVRAAALALAPTVDGTAVNVRDPARGIVEATLAEADRRASAMKFEVGPPPLNLSRGRKGGS